MKEGLLSDEQIKQSYYSLKKVSEQVKKDYEKISKANYGKNEWKKEGKKITSNLNKFEKMLKELKRNLERSKDSLPEESVSTVEDELEKIDDSVVPLVRKIRDKTINFQEDIELEDKENQNIEGEGQEQEQEQIQTDLMYAKEYIEYRGKEIKDIHKTSAMIFDITEKMKDDLNKQGEILNDVEVKVTKAEENVEIAKKEIIKANELSKGNNKRSCCFVYIIIGVVAVILIVVLSIVL